MNLCKFRPINLLIRKLSRILMRVAPLWMREFGPLYLNVLSTGRPLYLLINVLDIYVTNKRVIWSSLQIDISTVKDSDKDLEAHTKWHSVCLPDISGALICLFLMYLWRGRAGHFWHTELSFNSRWDPMQSRYDCLKTVSFHSLLAILYLDTWSNDPYLDPVPLIKNNIITYILISVSGWLNHVMIMYSV